MKKRWILIGISVLILLILFLRGVLLEMNSEKETEPPEDDGTVLEETEPQEKVIKNVWILQGKGQTLRFLTEEGEAEMPVWSELTEELSAEVADLYIRDEVIYRIVRKPDRITGRVLLLDEEREILELEGYETLELEEDLAVYDLRERETGSVKTGSVSQIILGYSAADFVVAEGKVCAVLISREIEPENIRVLIKTTGYGEAYHQEVRLQLQGTGQIAYELPEEEKVKKLKDGKKLTIKPDSKYLQGGRCVLTAEKGILVESVERSLGNPVYAGSLEILQTEQGLLLINEVDLETYLKGVLPSEMPSSFPEEALRVQAVCARSYACRQLLENGCRRYGAHVDDSVSYQVYQNAAGTEQTDAAVMDTEGQILTWEGEPALTSYFSTSCGMTSPAHKVWIGMDEAPYLMGQWQGKEADRPEEMDLSEEESFRRFLMEEENGYETGVSWYRWKTTISAEHLKKSIDSTLLARYRAAPELIQTWQDGAFVSVPVDTVGNVEKISVLSREPEGLVTAVEITGDQNLVRIYGEYNIRAVLAPLWDGIIRKDGSEISGASMLPSAYLLLEEEQQNGRLVSVTIRGGGYGHGVGMSQYGAKHLAEKGLGYQKILAHYYPGTQLQFLY